MNKIKLILLPIFFVLSIQMSQADCIPSSKGDSIIKNMITKYQSFLEYNDTGAAYKIRSKNKKEKRSEFKTHYEAPDNFSFQWETQMLDTKILNKVWGENQTAYMLFFDKTEKMSPSSALSSAHGVSGGVSFVVLPWILFQQNPCLSIEKIHYKIINEIQYKGKPTYIIQRSPLKRNYEILWVTKDTLILRKIEKHFFFKNNRESVTTIEYEKVSYK